MYTRCFCRGLFSWWLITTLLAAFVGKNASAEEYAWQYGIAKAKVTPQSYMWMSGYGGRDKPAEGKLTDLWVKVLVLEDQSKHIGVLITLDLVGIGRKMSQQICSDLKSRHGLVRDSIAICTSHTHTGPVVGRNLEPLHYMQVNQAEQRRIDKYAQWLRERVVSTVTTALANRKSGRLYWGSGRCTLATNRRENNESRVPELRRLGQLKGPTDHDVPVLSVRSPQGELKCVVFGYACHATVLSFFQWSGDYPGFAQIEAEKMLGCQAMFWAGCGADQNPLPRRSVALAQGYGRRLAKAAADVVGGVMRPVSAQLKTAYREIDLPLDRLPNKQEITKDTKSSNRFVAARARLLLKQIETNGKLAQTYPYPIGTWKLGSEVQFVTMGGEVVVDFAVRLKIENRQTKTWVAGYSHDVMAYIPSRRVLREGRYEGETAMIYYGLPTKWAPVVEKMIVEEVNRQLK